MVSDGTRIGKTKDGSANKDDYKAAVVYELLDSVGDLSETKIAATKNDSTYSSACKEGDLVKVVYELVDGIGSLSFYVNGIPAAETPAFDNIVGTVFPAVYITFQGDQVSIVST